MQPHTQQTVIFVIIVIITHTLIGESSSSYASPFAHTHAHMSPTPSPRGARKDVGSEEPPHGGEVPSMSCMLTSPFDLPLVDVASPASCRSAARGGGGTPNVRRPCSVPLVDLGGVAGAPSGRGGGGRRCGLIGEPRTAGEEEDAADALVMRDARAPQPHTLKASAQQARCRRVRMRRSPSERRQKAVQADNPLQEAKA